ncbi:Zinc finger, AN1-type [Kalmanozyma brasiliensis GHG001]|uniref:Zinc finger, AN1-type n=1 Tax=Kalmanozyma brasiliensis (strain GHG001) TaxID=1365824 RepID=UPI002867DADF|nr:Zinc finger, AN1-type [Kalmanozyma brasiliensis GHG001]EST09783.2 Zinc finger, AN1-type [Kalmanozyma brasiliensis GHG001]
MPERSTGPMMFIGERCAFDECHREDFLPFKCSDCRQHYCSNHFRPQTHRCSHYNESDVDYRVPLCPICDNPPEGWKRDQDPNIAMDRHLSGQCPKLDSNGYLKSNASIPSSAPLKQMSRAKKPNECSFVKCTKIMVVPIQCPQCTSSFCPSHRAPNQHSCKHASSSSSPTASSTRLAANGASGSGIKSAFQNLKISNTSAAAQKPAPTAKLNTSARQAATSTSSTASAPFGKMFDKSQKRAKAERLSAIRAMQARQQKGILSEADKLKLAEEMAALSKTERMKASDSDCVII